MNKIPAVITAVTRNEELCFVESLAGGIPFGILLFDLKQTLAAGSPVWLLFKESEVAVATCLCGETSFSNLFSGTVRAVKSGKILAQVCIDTPAGELCSLFTVRALARMKLEPGSAVSIMIKASQIALEARHDP